MPKYTSVRFQRSARATAVQCYPGLRPIPLPGGCTSDAGVPSSWAMRVTLSVAAVVATALAVAQPALPAPFRSHAAMSAATTTMPSSVERKRRPKALLRNLKACGRALYSASAHQCLHDERKRALLSNVAYCTVDVYAFATVRVGIKMTYGGQ